MTEATDNRTSHPTSTSEKNEDVTSNAPSKNSSPSPIGTALTQGRRALWQGNPPMSLHWLLNPLRLYAFDPVLTVLAILLPIAVPLKIDRFLARAFDFFCLPILRKMYGNQSQNDTNLAHTAGLSILHQPTVVSIQKPSDNYSAFLGHVSFLCSAIGDVAGIFTNPKKFKGWMDALDQFNTFLESTGLAAEMQDAIQKPLLRGRLLDNFKILHDIQEVHHADRVMVAQQEKSDGQEDLTEEIKIGCRLMRFATAAYGTEMIRSAVDGDWVPSELMDEPIKLIAFHTQLEEKDIQFVYANNNKSYDKHVLHHYVALNNSEKSVILAIRGTLSLSGVIVDVQGMAVDYCSGKAHRGMSEMATNLWTESGHKIVDLMEKLPDYKLIVTGHSLGAGTACLLTIRLHSQEVLKGRTIQCFAFAPPPTFWPCADNSTESPSCKAQIQQAMRNTVAYIHDNDVVPFLSVTAVHRMVRLLDSVDNETENIWFWKRWRIFYEYESIPEQITKSVLAAEVSSQKDGPMNGHCNMVIPARRVIWCKQNFAGRFEAFPCDPFKIAEGNIFLCPDMISDHLPEQYENALDALLEG